MTYTATRANPMIVAWALSRPPARGRERPARPWPATAGTAGSLLVRGGPRPDAGRGRVRLGLVEAVEVGDLGPGGVQRPEPGLVVGQHAGVAELGLVPVLPRVPPAGRAGEPRPRRVVPGLALVGEDPRNLTRGRLGPVRQLRRRAAPRDQRARAGRRLDAGAGHSLGVPVGVLLLLVLEGEAQRRWRAGSGAGARGRHQSAGHPPAGARRLLRSQGRSPASSAPMIRMPSLVGRGDSVL